MPHTRHLGSRSCLSSDERHAGLVGRKRFARLARGSAHAEPERVVPGALGLRSRSLEVFYT